MDEAAIEQAFNALDDNGKRAAMDLRRKGLTPRQAVSAARTQPAQERAYNMAEAESTADLETGGPTTGEKVASFAEGASKSLGGHYGPAVMSGVGAALTYPMDPLDAFAHAFREQSSDEEEAAAQAPGAFGGGGLTGDLANAAIGGAGAAKSVATTKFKPPDLSALALRAKAAVQGAVPDRAMKMVRTALGEGGEVAADDIVEAVPTTFEMPPIPREARAAALPTESGFSMPWEPAVSSSSATAPAAPTAGRGVDRLAQLGEEFSPRALIPDEVMPAAAPRSPQPAQTAIKGLLPAPAPPPPPAAAPPAAADPMEMWRQFMAMPVAPQVGAPMSAAQLKQAVQAGVNQGVPLKDLARSLGVNQGDIAAYFKAAQIGMLR